MFKKKTGTLVISEPDPSYKVCDLHYCFILRSRNNAGFCVRNGKRDEN